MSEVKVNQPDTLTGETGLCAAASAGEKSCCEILLRRGAKVLAPNLKEVPALHLAIASGNWAITDILLKEGASLEQTDNQVTISSNLVSLSFKLPHSKLERSCLTRIFSQV